MHKAQHQIVTALMLCFIVFLGFWLSFVTKYGVYLCAHALAANFTCVGMGYDVG